MCFVWSGIQHSEWVMCLGGLCVFCGCYGPVLTKHCGVSSVWFSWCGNEHEVFSLLGEYVCSVVGVVVF